MTFYDRYEKIVLAAGAKPISDDAANRIGITKGAISNWKKKGSCPRPAIIKKIAAEYDVSPEYLLGTSDNEKPEHPICVADEIPQPQNVKEDQQNTDYLSLMIRELDQTDRLMVESFIQGLITKKGIIDND